MANDPQLNVINDVLAAKFKDAEIPKFQVTFDPEEAAIAGAFVEEALSESDALEATLDLPEALEQ